MNKTKPNKKTFRLRISSMPHVIGGYIDLCLDHKIIKTVIYKDVMDLQYKATELSLLCDKLNNRKAA
jgi:hypothetical protein